MSVSGSNRQFNPLWQCRKCKRYFANRNQYHSCTKGSVEKFLAGKDPQARKLFAAFVKLVRRCGPVRFAPAKTRIGLQVRMIFAAVNRLTGECLDGHLILARRLEHRRFRRIESLGPRNHVHHFRITSPSELDEEMLTLIRESCRVGRQKHLG